MNTLGTAAEEQACLFLKSAGYDVLARNFSCKWGELDIVARHKNTLVFVEVKSRRSLAFGGPAAAVTPAKQNKISLAAVSFIKEKSLKFDSIRFDVICITGGKLEHIPNAFFPPRMNL